MILDMTKGNISKILFRFAIPIAAGNMLQQLYSLVDAVIVGQYAGVKSMAAIGSATNTVSLLINIAVGLNMGTNVILAAHFGGNDYSRLSKGVISALRLALIISILFSVGGVFAAPYVFEFMLTPQEMMSESLAYIRIYLSGLLFLFIFNISIAILQALGDSKTTLKSLVVCAVVNIVLDIIFIRNMRLGVAGAALATVIAEFICCIWSSSVLYRTLIRLKIKDWNKKIELEETRRIVNASVPAIVQRSVIAIGVTIMQSLINSYGINVMAGYAAATKITALVTLPVMDIGNSIATFTAQNYGAHKKERVERGIWSAIMLDIPFSIIILILVFTSGTRLLSLFIKDVGNYEAMNFGLRYLYIICIFQIIQGVLQVYNGAIRGAGDSRGFMISYSLNLLCRVLSGYILAYFGGLNFIPFAWPIGWLVGLLIGYYCYRKIYDANIRNFI
ncbi:putative efflux protein, MATE family [Pseudobutyrivibrio sp. YE44]|uniref:MATE family efflux transporter n=1 Tax=Pseudobutyrivibrio sp. YE44 TaxID=1520802 RepID=UPI0008847EF6|nr:MATE family efflux transporter [Pseudobutyrivibrio sp. YE44]SDB14716.1 putative efflux protein, MATE family [Pseudobutyrivibrio sp. YE44]